MYLVWFSRLAAPLVEVRRDQDNEDDDDDSEQDVPVSFIQRELTMCFLFGIIYGVFVQVCDYLSMLWCKKRNGYDNINSSSSNHRNEAIQSQAGTLEEL